MDDKQNHQDSTVRLSELVRLLQIECDRYETSWKRINCGHISHEQKVKLAGYQQAINDLEIIIKNAT